MGSGDKIARYVYTDYDSKQQFCQNRYLQSGKIVNKKLKNLN